MAGSLDRCERDVEAARARLAGDLHVLRRPETVESFTRAIKIELMTAKDAAIESAKTSAFGAVSDAVDKLKSKAAANPAALLAIGAGLAWHFVRNPPVVTALVGAGLFSLLKTSAPAVPPEDFIAHSRERLKEQVGEFSDMAKATAQSASEAVSQKVSEVTRTGVQAATDMAHTVSGQISGQVNRVTDEITQVTGQVTDQVKEQFSQAASRGMEAASDMAAQVRRTRHDITDKIMEGVDTTTGAVRHAMDRGNGHWNGQGQGTGAWEGNAPSLVPNAPRAQDTILLGIAGVAVAAALGLALQRASNES